MNYLDKLDQKTRDYFQVLEPDFPEWLLEYINTKELLHQQHISNSCGLVYSKLFPGDYFFSSLDHSVGVALVVWHFTHDKKQTLAGLFHDIATPVFKHSIDFLNGDYMVQESTEDLTTQIIAGSAEITALLKRDGIKISEVDDYHKYPIADNDTPQLSADRLEYSLSNALLLYHMLMLDEIKEIYDDIEVQKNAEGIDELGFKTKQIARKFVKVTSELSVIYRGDSFRYSMQFLADVIKGLNEDGVISKEDLYALKESEVINIIEKSRYGEVFKKWRAAEKVQVSATRPDDVYYVHHGAKVRYIDPLFQGERMSEACKIAKRMIDKNLAYDMSNYVYLDFKL